MTLLIGRKNSAASNKGFPEKKAAYLMPKKSKNTKTIPALHITQEILSYEEWNADSLRARHEQLKGEIMALWSVRDKTPAQNKTIFGG